jgi:penicillin-binding protein 2
MTKDLNSYLPKTQDPTRFLRRIVVMLLLVFLLFSALLARLVYLQVLKTGDYTARAESNRKVVVPITSTRGLVRDRNGEMLAQNYWAYSLEIRVSDMQRGKKIDELLDELSEIVDITPGDRRRFKRLREESRRFESVTLLSRLTDEDVARIVANRWRFPGVNIQPRLFREYPQKNTASHLIGYIGRISRSDIERIESEGLSEDYQGTHQIGKVGIERSYEDTLRGQPGHEMVEVTAGGRRVRSLGSIDAEQGKNLELSLDLNLQRVAEHAFGSDTGAAIAIDPKTGEILAFVSMPTYDPNNFPNGIDPDVWKSLSGAPEKPLLNRAARGLYPIGSTYKPFMALAGLEYGVITPSTTINDTGVFEYHNHKFRDASGTPKGKVDLFRSIVISSDVYYYWLASQLGIDRIHPFMQQWGFGQKTGIDIVGEQAGTLPDREWKRKRFRQFWFPGDTVNLGIGQGYNQFTLLQLAHATATLANKGVVMTPHLVRRIIDPDSGESTWLYREPVRTIPLSPESLSLVTRAMTDVTRVGTARKPFEGVTYPVAGKTGTAQVITIAQEDQYDKTKIARQHHDHGLFIAFAPANNPKIALAILKENGGFGAQAAAPIAREMLDYWITGANQLGLPAPAHLRGAATPGADFPVPPKAAPDGKGAAAP